MKKEPMNRPDRETASIGPWTEERILLLLLPFWTPLIPPLGISCLKAFLRRHGCGARTVDFNTVGTFRQIYDRYFDILKENIPPHKRGNFYNVGSDVLQNHMLAGLHREDEQAYVKLVKTVIFKTFYHEVEDDQVHRLNRVVEDFYAHLEKDLLELLEEEKPTVLGVSVYSGTLGASLFALRLTREKYPHIATVMGGGIFAGHLATGSPNLDTFLEKTPYIDHLFVGEGEILFLKWLRRELPSSRRVYTLEDIDGEIMDLSGADIPDFSDFDLRFYPHLASYTSRSCPFQCKFCAETIQWGVYRKKRGGQIAAELLKLYEDHGQQLFLMGDSLLNPVITELAEAFSEEDTSIYWDGYLRVDPRVCSGDFVFRWRRGGFYRARLGVESGARRILEAMDKRITVDQVRSAVRNLARQGIKTTTYWVIGYPGETEEDFRATLDFVEELKNDIYEAECNPFQYFPTGQVNSDGWARRAKRTLLYPPWAGTMLPVQTWVLDVEPGRENTYERMNRFVEHCRKLQIPNPYSLNEIYRADERWKKLHKNAVPSLAVFENKRVYVDENKKVENLLCARKSGLDEGDFVFKKAR